MPSIFWLLYALMCKIISLITPAERCQRPGAFGGNIPYNFACIIDVPKFLYYEQYG